MPAVDVSTLAPALKQLVDNDVVKLFEQEAVLHQTIQKATNAEFVNGKGYRLPNKMWPAGGHTYFSEGGSFNMPTPFGLKDMYVYPTRYALPMEFTGDAIRNAKDPSSLIRWLTPMMQDYTETAIKEIEEQIPGDGRGIKSIIASVAAGPPATITGVTTSDGTPYRTKGTQYLGQNQWYEAIDSATEASWGVFKVLIPGPSTVTVNLLPGSAGAGDFIVHPGGYKKAFRGLAYLVNNDSGVFQLLSRADYPLLKSPVLDLDDATLSPAHISKLKAYLQYRQGNQNASKSLTAIIGFGQYELLRRQGFNLRRYMKDDAVQGVANSYTDGDTSFLPNTNIDEDRVYLIDLSDIHRYEQMPMGLFNLDQQTIRMNPGINGVGSDKYYAAIGTVMNLGIRTPAKHALIKQAATTDIATQVLAYT